MYRNPQFATGKHTSPYLADPLVAHLPGVTGAVRVTATGMAAVADSRLQVYRATIATESEGNSRIVVASGRTDSYVVLDDNGAGHGAAVKIEQTTGALSAALASVGHAWKLSGSVGKVGKAKIKEGGGK